MNESTITVMVGLKDLTQQTQWAKVLESFACLFLHEVKARDESRLTRMLVHTVFPSTSDLSMAGIFTIVVDTTDPNFHHQITRDLRKLAGVLDAYVAPGRRAV